MILESGVWYTLEELVERTGLATKTLYNWSSYNFIPKARRGLVPGNPSLGVYPVGTLDRIRKIIQLKVEQGLSMKEIQALLESNT